MSHGSRSCAASTTSPCLSFPFWTAILLAGGEPTRCGSPKTRVLMQTQSASSPVPVRSPELIALMSPSVKCLPVSSRLSSMLSPQTTRAFPRYGLVSTIWLTRPRSCGKSPTSSGRATWSTTRPTPRSRLRKSFTMRAATRFVSTAIRCGIRPRIALTTQLSTSTSPFFSPARA